MGIVAALVPSLLRITLHPYLGVGLPYAFYFPATMFTALFGGLGPAWLGIGICAGVTAVWILPRAGSLAVSNTIDLAGLAVFIAADGIIAWIGASHRDLIEQSERQSAELAAREQDLAVAVVQAEAANQAKDDFLAILSHELRTPLTTIIAGVQVLRQIGGPDARAGNVHDAIERQANQLTRLVEDLLDVKRIVAGPVVLERRPCDLGEAFTGFVTTWNGLGRFKDHRLFVDAEPVWVNGDTARLQQVVDNLISNAVKYTPAGGLISVSLKREREEAVLRVHDTGIGISPDLLPRLFDLFVQGDPGSERVRSGLGVGLAVVRRLVELHDGTVTASSDGPGRGSTFTVRLPCVAPSA